LDLGHASAAKDQRAKLVDEPILVLRIIVFKIRLQPLEELPLAALLAFQAQAHERGNRFAHACVDGLGIPLYLASHTQSQSDRVSRLALASKVLGDPSAAESGALRI